MKTKNAILVASLIIVLAWISFNTLSNPEKSTPRASLKLQEPTGVTGTLASTASKRAQASQVLNPPRLPASNSTDDYSSLIEMTQTLERFTNAKSTVKDLVDYLDRSQQRPITTHDSNPYSGDMAIVRTSSPLPGTRYFHAQFFNNADGSSFVQHMSFEFKPGPNAMEEAIRAVQKTFAVSTPKVLTKDYAQWPFRKEYTLWVKKMAESDLKDDPFNAYTTADIGTIRVAIELEVH